MNHNSLQALYDINRALDETSIVAITDRTGIIQHVNDKFCEISGYTEDELLGQSHRIVNSGYHPRSFFTEMWQTIGRGKVWRRDVKNMSKDRNYYWVDTTVVPFLDKDGRPYQYLAVRNIITEQKLIALAMESLIELTNATYDDEQHFVDSALKSLQRLLGVNLVILSEVKDMDADVKSFASSQGMDFFDGYNLMNTPCFNLFKDDYTFVGKDLGEKYPGDLFITEHNLESYMGYVLNRSDDRFLYICMLDDKVM